MERVRTVALLARPPGLAVLEHWLLPHPALEVLAVWTHARRPRSEDPARGERPELARFEALCARSGVPLVAVDDPGRCRSLDGLAGLGPVDLLCSVSWRFVVDAAALRGLRVGGINLHRGALPEYAGGEPVLRMLRDGRTEVAITAHVMAEEVDAGPVLATVRHPMGAAAGRPEAPEVERVKRELVPLYAPLMELALAALRARAALTGGPR